MSASGFISVNFEGLSMAAQSLMATARKIDAASDALRASVAPLRASWVGTAGLEFDASTTRLERAEQELMFAFGNMAKKTDDVRGLNEAAEAGNAARFGAA